METFEEDSKPATPPAGPRNTHPLDSDTIIATATAEIRRQNKVNMKMMIIPTTLVAMVVIPVAFLSQSQWFAENLLQFARPPVFIPAIFACLIPLFSILYIISRRLSSHTQDSVQLLATLDVPEAVPPLIDLYSGILSVETTDMAKDALTRLLSSPRVAASIDLSPSRRSILRCCLKDAYTVHVRTGDTFLSRRMGLHDERCDKALTFRIAVLSSWRYTGGPEELQIIQSICKWKHKTSTCAALQAVAQEVMPYVEERVARLSQTGQLLRPAYKGEVVSELLMPIEANKQLTEEPLLRSVEGPVSDGVAEVTSK